VSKDPHKGGDYDIGYGKPPTQTQFQKGVSGNPRGRPKGSKNLKSLARKVMNTKVTLRENGKTRTVSKAEAMLMAVFNRGLSGDASAARISLSVMQLALAESEGQGAAPDALPLQTQDDLTVLSDLMKRYGGEPTRTTKSKSRARRAKKENTK
jgi:hypothetical protein